MHTLSPTTPSAVSDHSPLHLVGRASRNPADPLPVVSRPVKTLQVVVIALQPRGESIQELTAPATTPYTGFPLHTSPYAEHAANTTSARSAGRQTTPPLSSRCRLPRQPFSKPLQCTHARTSARSITATTRTDERLAAQATSAPIRLFCFCLPPRAAWLSSGCRRCNHRLLMLSLS